MDSFVNTLEQYGADITSVRFFDTDEGPAILQYATLLAARKSTDSILAALTGVYEWQDNPLIFLLEGEKLTSRTDLDRIRRLLAMRGDAPYLGVVTPGRLTVYRVALDNNRSERARVQLRTGSERTAFPYLCNTRPGLGVPSQRLISRVVLSLLVSSIEELTGQFEVSDHDAISLVGRALFTRFLADRGLLPPSLIDGSRDAAELFDNAARASKTSAWLDDTFNGDFLPVRSGRYDSLPHGAYRALGNILRRAEGGQLSLVWEEKWANLDFSHIPVGVLSQAYELYLRRYAPIKQRKEGGYYTPRPIADTMVRGAIHSLRRDGSSHRARVLDAAAGAGVFLITVLRELVSERWRHDGVRPDTAVLREILYQQITGFDINEAALRFAALALYLASIELDPNPEPVEKLRFKNLRGTVLHQVGDNDGSSVSTSLGSLGKAVGPEHSGRYDLVIGNPPWASGTQLPEWHQVLERVEQIASTRIPAMAAPKLPNEVLDLPFVWRAMEWARPGGHIALALHARILFQQGEGMPQARAAIFAAINVTGIINGSEIRNTKVWPEISAPFCLLFARNEVSPPGAGFRFVSPRTETSLNNAGGFRIDSSNADVVATDQVLSRPQLLKVLFRGTSLDLEIFDRLQSRQLTTLDRFWTEELPLASALRPRLAGNGYQMLRPSSRIRTGKTGDGLPGVSASYLKDLRLKDVTARAMESVLLDVPGLHLFSEDRIHDRRPADLFSGPLLLVRKSPPASTGRIQAAVADDSVVFNETYYGYSAAEHPDGRRFVRFLALMLGSKFALWHSLITSGEFGFEREVIEKFSIDKLPIPYFETLDESNRTKLDNLFDLIAAEGTEKAWRQVDEWALVQYGLRESDLQVITETLEFNLPFANNRKAAQSAPTPPRVALFCDALAAELAPWGNRVGRAITARQVNLPIACPWNVVQLGPEMTRDLLPAGQEWHEVLRVADQLAASEVIYRDSTVPCLWLARLNQARYWSASQARLVARRIAWEHIDFLLSVPQLYDNH